MFASAANRVRIANSQILQKSFSVLNHADSELVVSALRVLGNSIAENGSFSLLLFFSFLFLLFFFSFLFFFFLFRSR